MVVILVLFTLVFFLVVDHLKTWNDNRIRTPRGTMYTSPGFEMLGALAQDGGSTMKSEDAETEEVLAKLKRTKTAKVSKPS